MRNLSSEWDGDSAKLQIKATKEVETKNSLNPKILKSLKIKFAKHSHKF